MKLTLLIILTFVSSVFASDNFSLKYKCTNLADDTDVRNLFYLASDEENDLSSEIIFTESLDYILDINNQDTHFKLELEEGDLFITERKPVTISDQPYGEVYLELDDELILKQNTEVSTNNCAGDFSIENCFIAVEFQCAAPGDIATETPANLATEVPKPESPEANQG